MLTAKRLSFNSLFFSNCNFPKVECMLNDKQCEFGATFAKSMLNWNHVCKFCFTKMWYCLLHCYWHDTYQQLYVREKARKYITQLLMCTILELPCDKKFDQTIHNLSCRFHFISDKGAKNSHIDIQEMSPSSPWIYWI